MLKSAIDLRDVDFVLSSNPPNPKTSFRLGDWICSSPKCAAHNFGRNISCIGCGSQRSPTSPSAARPAISSPRFNSALPTNTPPVLSTNNPSPHHPLLTPSGRAFAIGGKVQNISSDPLNPCIMYWPDNEPFPEQGQIRPSGLVGIPQPPILNTGNRGPISHQPGDWICQKCNYLNWRRRKVCQTCLPYAEGNGDSISAAVQAERIALLTNVLSQSRLDPNATFQVPVHPPHSLFISQQSSSGPNVQRSHSLTPPAERRPGSGSGSSSFLQVPSPHGLLTAPTPGSAALPNGLNRQIHRSQSHFSLGQQRQLQQQMQMQRHLAPSPIYQTPLPSSSGGLLTPQHQQPPQQLSISPSISKPFQQVPVQVQRNISPLPTSMPLLYSTPLPPSSGLGANLNTGFQGGMTGQRMRVLSSPAAAMRTWGVDATLNNNTTGSASSSSCSGSCSVSTSASGSVSSIGSISSIDSMSGPKICFDEAAGRVMLQETHQLRFEEDSSEEEGGESKGTSKTQTPNAVETRSAAQSETTTPAIATPLLPAFLRDVVSPRTSGEEKEERQVLSPMESWREKERDENLKDGLVPLPTLTPSPSPHGCNPMYLSNYSRMGMNAHPSGPTMMTTTTTGHPQLPPLPRARNDSAASTCSSSSSSAASLSGSGMSGSLSPASLTSNSMSSLNLPVGSPPLNSTASSGSTSANPNPNPNSKPTPFMTFGGSGGIWRMDGEELGTQSQRPLTGFYAHRPHQHAHHHGSPPGSGTPLPLPIGAGRRL